jgi:hypothetical protein
VTGLLDLADFDRYPSADLSGTETVDPLVARRIAGPHHRAFTLTIAS